MNRLLLSCFVPALLLAAPASAQEQPARRPTTVSAERPLGLTLTAAVGGGGQLGGGSRYSPSGLFEGEVAVGYEVGLGIRPELGLLLGLAPGTYVGLRPGVHYANPDLGPAYLRVAIDWSTQKGFMQGRWFMAGAGLEGRLTDLLGGFVEANTGFPIATGYGLPFELRAGVSFRF